MQTSSFTQTFHTRKTLIHVGAKSKDTNLWVVIENAKMFVVISHTLNQLMFSNMQRYALYSTGSTENYH